jgi:hypothetical protein
MENDDFVMPEHTVAEGPQGLMAVLEKFLHQSEQDAEFRAKEHYIMYRLKDQKSLIKVDMSKRPFQFWYYDLLGRPATKAVKDTVAEFLWEKAGEKERYTKEYQGESDHG